MYDLGQNVQLETVDGVDRVCFVVDPAARPTGWPPAIDLPRGGEKSGNLNDPVFRASVIRDAEKLNLSLLKHQEKERLKTPPQRTLHAVAAYYLASKEYSEVGKDRAYRNKLLINKALKWFESWRDTDVTIFTKDQLEEYLDEEYGDRPHYKLQMRSALNILFRIAMKELKWRPDNPMNGIPWTEPNVTSRRLWKLADVELYAAACRRAGQPGLGALIEAQLYAGQRLGDMRRAQHGHEYKDGHFEILQAKTGTWSYAVVPTAVHQKIMEANFLDSPFLFVDYYTGKPFTIESLNHRFSEVRHYVARKGEGLLQLSSLRHSCVHRMYVAGESLESIAHVTGHKYSSIHQIMEHYLHRSAEIGEDAIRRTHKANGGSDADFLARPAAENFGVKEGLKRYLQPEWDPDKPTISAARLLGINPRLI